MFQRAH